MDDWAGGVVNLDQEYYLLNKKEKAKKEYEKYRVVQDKNYISDFDREVKKVLEVQKGGKRSIRS